MRIQSNPAFVPLDAEAVHAMRRRLLNAGAGDVDTTSGTGTAEFFALSEPRESAVAHARRREIHDDTVKNLTPAAPPAGTDSASPAAAPEDLAAAASTARKLEGVMLTSLMTRMREAAGVEFFGGTPGAQVFEGMFDQMMGDSLAEGRGIGLYKEVERSILGRRGTADLTGSAAAEFHARLATAGPARP